ncbi:hypothetical protein ACNKHQ_09110 [Shigella flexneri]
MPHAAGPATIRMIISSAWTG